MEYRHCTNIRTPYSPVDENFLFALSDYKIGPPTPSKRKTALSFDDLVNSGIVGVYTTEQQINRPEIKKLTGWSVGVLGVPLENKE